MSLGAVLGLLVTIILLDRPKPLAAQEAITCIHIG
jgi:hypothetical protein